MQRRSWKVEVKHVTRCSSTGTVWLILGARKSNISTGVFGLLTWDWELFNTPLTQASKGTYLVEISICFYRKKINQKSQCEFFQEFWGYNLRKQGEFWYIFCTLDLLTVIMNVPIFYRFHTPWAISSPEDHDHHGYSPELRERLYLYTWRYWKCGYSLAFQKYTRKKHLHFYMVWINFEHV